MLAVLRMTAWLATILVGAITIPLGVLVWHAPLIGTLKSYLYGGLTGFWVIDWITFWGLIIFNTLVFTGDFERFKNWMVHHATADIRIQTIMLAWAFGALLEGLVGFGYSVGRSWCPFWWGWELPTSKPFASPRWRTMPRSPTERWALPFWALRQSQVFRSWLCLRRLATSSRSWHCFRPGC